MFDPRPAITAPPENELYNAYAVEEEAERSAYHYELPADFFYTLMGGEWHTYSCYLWEDGFNETQAQECKLDKMAELMGLKRGMRGMRVMDVGCGWGGPLVYWCHKYGAIGAGVTVTERQIPEAQRRAARYGADAQFILAHWKDLPEEPTYDVITTDEVLVHFHDLEDFFAKCWKLLKPGGMMVHKELHFTSTQFATLGPIAQHVNKIYGYTCNYVVLHRELKALDEAGFRLTNVYDIPMAHYLKTVDTWQRNIFNARDRLIPLIGEQVYKDFRAYIKGIRYVFTRTGIFTLNIVATKKVG